MIKDSRQRLFEMMHKVGGMLILTEIDWEGDFNDVSKECISADALKEYLNKVLVNRTSPLNPPNKSLLFVHRKAILFDENGEIDVQAFIKNITTYPQKILNRNKKVEKSSTDNSITFNFGIPALRGLVYDMENNQFYIVNTCPGAGSCQNVCYARKGRYIALTDVFLKQTRILNLLLNKPDDFKKILKSEIEILLLKNRDKKIFLMWNDAGDFFSRKYFQIAKEITHELQAMGYNFSSYAHTKMGDIYNLSDPDVILNFSVDANEKERKKVDLTTAKTSEIVPLDLFRDLFVRNKYDFVVNSKGKLIPPNENSISILKQRIANKFNVDINTLIMYDDLIKKPKGNVKKYNVIVLPKGDGDISAQRRDVKKSFLLYH